EARQIMYKLGILKEERQQDAHVNEFSNSSAFTPSFFTCINKNEEILSNMNAILIEEGENSGFESICESILELRKWFEGVVWVFSTKISDFHQMIYFQLGADGISDVAENKGLFLLQLENLLKHTGNGTEVIKETQERPEKRSDFELNEGSLSLILKDGFEISLTKLEFFVLRELFNRSGETLSYEELYQKIWTEKKNGTDATFRQYRVTNLIFHLRKKFEAAPGSPEYIKTIRSKGYKLDIK
ncbi:winged helix-turn-helix domain-containing protein, partial [Enterococcus ureasiticus]